MPMKFAIFLKCSLLFFNSFYCLFCLWTKLYNSIRTTKTTINAKISVFVICVESIIYSFLYNLHECTFKMLWCPRYHCECLKTSSCFCFKQCNFILVFFNLSSITYSNSSYFYKFLFKFLQEDRNVNRNL